MLLLEQLLDLKNGLSSKQLQANRNNDIRKPINKLKGSEKQKIFKNLSIKQPHQPQPKTDFYVWKTDRKEMNMANDKLKRLIEEAKNYTKGNTIEVLAYLSGRLESNYPDISEILYTILEETRKEQTEYELNLINKTIDTTLKIQESKAK